MIITKILFENHSNTNTSTFINYLNKFQIQKIITYFYLLPISRYMVMTDNWDDDPTTINFLILNTFLKINVNLVDTLG